MTPKLVPDDSRPNSAAGPRALAPGAPLSPGPLPEDLQDLLDRGEALIWWNQKEKIDWVSPAVTLVICLMLLGAITMLAPTFWARSPVDFWGPVAAMLLPAAFMLVREYFGRGLWMVTERRIVAINHQGLTQSLPFRSIREVKRDVLAGGVRLTGNNKFLRVTPRYCKDARIALRSQIRNKVLGSGDKAPTDLVGGWFPKSR